MDLGAYAQIEDLDTAIAIKKAYCDGYYDRKSEENNND